MGLIVRKALKRKSANCTGKCQLKLQEMDTSNASLGQPRVLSCIGSDSRGDSLLILCLSIMLFIGSRENQHRNVLRSWKSGILNNVLSEICIISGAFIIQTAQLSVDP